MEKRVDNNNDGTPDMAYAYELDANGNTVSMKRDSGANGSFEYYEEYMLDAVGNKKVVLVDANYTDGATSHTFERTELYTYDTYGNATLKQISYGENREADTSRVVSYESYKYDQYGNRIEAFSDADNNPDTTNSKSVNTYDIYGHVAQTTTYSDSEGNPTAQSTYEYNANGQRTSVTTTQLTDRPDGLISTTIEYTYDDQGRIASHTSSNTYKDETRNYIQTGIYTYDDANHLVMVKFSGTNYKGEPASNLTRIELNSGFDENAWDKPSTIKSVMGDDPDGTNIQYIAHRTYDDVGSPFRTLFEFNGSGYVSQIQYGISGNGGSNGSDDYTKWDQVLLSEAGNKLSSIWLSTPAELSITLDKDVLTQLTSGSTSRTKALRITGSDNDTVTLLDSAEFTHEELRNSSGALTFNQYTTTENGEIYQLLVAADIDVILG